VTAPTAPRPQLEPLQTLHLPPEVDRAELLEPWTRVLQVPPYPLAVDESADYRRAMTRRSPIRFALLYLPHHLRSAETGGVSSLASHHFLIHEIGAAWRRPGRHRDILVAPRYGAKSTWMVILTLWALCLGHRRFALWISDSAAQVQLHLATLRQELESNELLRHDFPHMLPPPRGQRGARDSQDTFTSRGGAVIAVRGADTKSLGMKLGSSRPGLIWLDDVEPEESNYSAAARRKRLGTILHAILPMNEQAAVMLSGTVTMYGSITHAAVQAATGEADPPEEWISDEGFAVHYVPALTIADDGTPRSFWPQRYSAQYLMSIRHTRNYALNFACRPPLPGGHQWTEKTFRHGQHPVGALVMQIDPAPTATPKSDYSAIIIGGLITDPALSGHVSLEYAEQVRLTPARLKDRVDLLLLRNPRIRRVRIAATGGSETWRHVFRDLPGGVALELHGDHRSNSGRPGAPSKDLKFADLLERYERGTVWHAEHFPELEDQLKRWPEVEHDDLGDCASELVRELQGPVAPPR
jgi:hypothetical protein